MKREDWIILRLIFTMMKHDYVVAARDLTVHRAINDLIKRCGEKTVHAAIDQLKKEEAK